MSMWYADAGVLILNEMASPALTLIDVAKPWMVESPASLIRQSLSGSPGWVFSHAITLCTGGPHGFSAAPPRAGGTRAASSASVPVRISRRRHGLRDRFGLAGKEN